MRKRSLLVAVLLTPALAVPAVGLSKAAPADSLARMRERKPQTQPLQVFGTSASGFTLSQPIAEPMYDRVRQAVSPGAEFDLSKGYVGV
jgi:hypothetical protein